MMRLMHAAIVLTLAALFLMSVRQSPADQQAAKGVNWQTDLYEAHTLSVATGKPMLLVFGADWCHYCRKLKSTTLSHPQMIAYINNHFVPVYLDADEHREVAEILGVKPLPSTVVLSPEADLLGKIVGFYDARKYYGALNQARQLQARISQAKYSGNNKRR